MMDFSGTVALVTGAGSGMGRATALAFASAGAKVVVGDVDDAGGTRTVEDIESAGGTASYVHVDVSRDAEVAALVAHAADTYGGLDHAVNCAAIEIETAALPDCPEETFDRVVAVNLKGVFLCLRHEIAQMRRGGRGAIVNIASVNAFRPQPHQPVYTATKHAVLGLTRSAAIDHAAEGIRVNAICPGGIDTPMLRNSMARKGRDPDEVASRLSLANRFGAPEEIAKAALWLCSDDSAYTFGHALAVDGGYLAR
ncbi:glucose 1-dehydrogenase [Actinophytocola sp.]|uniref:glucose 1-dehydrogenase n=1 Tax=Actinophytocola sp. TaxID=1872138 RepID=UPI002ED3D8C0